MRIVFAEKIAEYIKIVPLNILLWLLLGLIGESLFLTGRK